jgi:hypothetical protein
MTGVVGWLRRYPGASNVPLAFIIVIIHLDLACIMRNEDLHGIYYYSISLTTWAYESVEAPQMHRFKSRREHVTAMLTRLVDR